MKALQFALAVTLRIGSSNSTKFKAEENFGPLTPSYSLQDETTFHHKLEEKYTKTANYDNAVVENRDLGQGDGQGNGGRV